MIVHHKPDLAVTLRIAPEQGVDIAPEGLTYGVPDSLADLEIGERVVVPLGRSNRNVTGVVIEVNVSTDLDPSKIKPIRSRDERTEATLTPDLVQLGEWIARYYACPLGITLSSMLPAAVRRGIGRRERVYIDFADEFDGSDPPVEHRLTRLQKSLIEALQTSDVRPVEINLLCELAGARTTGPVNRLVESKVLKRVRRSDVTASWEAEAARWTQSEITLTAEQQRVIDAVSPTLNNGFSVHAIFGVTGSGKTEVYMELIERVLDAGHAALVLVPEISLTPQTIGRFRARFEEHFHSSNQHVNSAGTQLAVLHSGLTDAQRHEQWQWVRDGRASLVIGARSAVFAPFSADRLALIVVDEEHDHSYKQDQAPRYHARDVAVRRGQQLDATVVLGSATPSLETYANARLRNQYHWHELTQRIPGAALPQVEIVDLLEERRRRPRTDKHVHLLGPRLEGRLKSTLDEGGDAILLLNRRGYANYIACPDHQCGWVMTCEHCDAAMVYHINRDLPRGGFVRCHHCFAEQRLPEQCPVCKKRVNTFGLGTQRIEEELARKFPDLAAADAIIRMDSDTMRRTRDYDEALERFRHSEARILLGTQMIAKGLDFPNVRLVGVVNADTAVNLPDFRASERTYQLVAQVAGRSGRRAHAGRVVVQTFIPGLPAIRYAAAHDYHGFAQREISDRVRAGLPPIGRMARIVVRHRDQEECTNRARRIRDAIDAVLPSVPIPTIDKSLVSLSPEVRQALTTVPPLRLRGPAPCPLSRIADHHRWSIEIISTRGPAPIQTLLTRLRNQSGIRSDAATAIDIDPTHLL